MHQAEPLLHLLKQIIEVSPQKKINGPLASSKQHSHAQDDNAT